MRFVRRVALAIAFAVAAMLVGVAVLLAEAHWEIRGIHPPLPELSTVATLPAVADGPLRLRYVTTASQANPDGSVIGHPSFVVEWADGRILLVDVGMDRAGAEAFGKTLETLLGSEAIEARGPVTEQLGGAFERVAAIAFTHLHIDHVGALAAICRAATSEIRLFQTRWQAELGNFSTTPGREVIDGVGCTARSRLADATLTEMPGFAGVYAIAAGGHTPGSTIYVIRLPEGIVVLAGDVTNSFDALLRNEPKPVIYSLFIVPEAPARLEQLRLWLAKLHRRETVTVLVSHDELALGRSGIPEWAP